jgi:hypothetical protein
MEPKTSASEGPVSFGFYPHTKEEREHTLHRQRRYSMENIHFIDKEDIPQ